jgi:hypothetical protein
LKHSEDGQIPEKSEVPSPKATPVLMKAIEAENAYAEKLTVMFSTQLIGAVCDIPQK